MGRKAYIYNEYCTDSVNKVGKHFQTLGSVDLKYLKRIMKAVNFIAVLIVFDSSLKSVCAIRVIPRVSTHASKPTISTSPQSLNVVAGQTVQLPCEVENLGTHVVLWKHNQSQILFVDGFQIHQVPRYQLARNQGLTIENASRSDSGQFTCAVTVSPPDTVEVTHELRVLPKNTTSIRKKPQAFNYSSNSSIVCNPICKTNGSSATIETNAEFLCSTKLQLQSIDIKYLNTTSMEQSIVIDSLRKEQQEMREMLRKVEIKLAVLANQLRCDFD